MYVNRKISILSELDIVSLCTVGFYSLCHLGRSM